MKKLLIPIIAVVVVVVLALVYFLVIAPGGEKEEPEVISTVYNAGENFTINVKGVDGKESGRLFRTGIYLVVDERMLEQLSDSASPTVPLIRDTIIFTLRDLTAAEIADANGQDKIREKIVNAINDRLGLVDEPGKLSPPKVLDVYFTDFVMQ